ncbi:MAG TPA: Stp1/IreP family PP2C-type Ser/Thr phosphatase [Gaiellales bacterium]|jgi:protein phosphatase|nr:Stp1/IreP family PP2C-type Ser/Thr phosphatase [Gaiellales bacterium]
MTLGIVDSAGVTQTGNVRRSNEDSYLMRSPLFMVADGMGGAQAGEIASRMCAEAFARADLIGPAPTDVLRATIQAANSRILERSRSDPDAAGMGTTVTAAFMDDSGTIAFAHVGDSRAYLLRDGSLQRLSDDHSLVGELVRKGELSETDAERHPQRSVITRALGTDESVEVDTFEVRAQDDDVFLLCSDGLNTMVPEPTIADILARSGAAAALARELVKAALAGGGEDNVTAIVFRVGETTGEAQAEAAAATDGRTHILPAGLEDDQHDDDDDEGGGLRARTIVALLGAGVLAVALAVAAVIGLRQSHFIGADTATGRVAVYQGVPVDLPFGVHLYHVVYESTVSYATLKPRERKTLFDHTLRSDSGAMSTLRPYEVASP